MFKKNVLLFLRYNPRNWAGALEEALGWNSWGRRGRKSGDEEKKEENGKELLKVFIKIHESREWVMVHFRCNSERKLLGYCGF